MDYETELKYTEMYLLDYNLATLEEIHLVTKINGYTLDTLTDILYVRTGLRSIKQDTEFMNYIDL